jgi:hypothetical protein
MIFAALQYVVTTVILIAVLLALFAYFMAFRIAWFTKGTMDTRRFYRLLLATITLTGVAIVVALFAEAYGLRP